MSSSMTMRQFLTIVLTPPWFQTHRKAFSGWAWNALTTALMRRMDVGGSKTYVLNLVWCLSSEGCVFQCLRSTIMFEKVVCDDCGCMVHAFLYFDSAPCRLPFQPTIHQALWWVCEVWLQTSSGVCGDEIPVQRRNQGDSAPFGGHSGWVLQDCDHAEHHRLLQRAWPDSGGTEWCHIEIYFGFLCQHFLFLQPLHAPWPPLPPFPENLELNFCECIDFVCIFGGSWNYTPDPSSHVYLLVRGFTAFIFFLVNYQPSHLRNGVCDQWEDCSITADDCVGLGEGHRAWAYDDDQSFQVATQGCSVQSDCWF